MITNQLPDTRTPRSRPRRPGGPPPTRRRSLVVVLLAALLGALSLVALPGSPPPAGAQDAPTTTLAEGQDEGIIPQPNSGREPEEAGDRGGALQLLVFALVLAAIAVIVAMIVRESRKARRVDALR